MSDKIIRLGGSHAGNTRSLENLVAFVKRHDGRCLIVVSAVPQLLGYIRNAVSEAFNNNIDLVSDRLNSFYTEITGTVPSRSYNKLADQLTGILRGIGLIGDYSEALKDQVLSFSEKLTAEIFKVQLAEFGLDTRILWPEDLDLRVTPDSGNATFISLNTKKLDEFHEPVFLVPGSYGITESGKIGRAGKTAADYTAAFLTRYLTPENWNFGVSTLIFKGLTQPLFPMLRVIKRLTYSEASELAYFDHYSFHPRTVEPLETEHIPIYIVNTESGNGKTETVINTETFVEPQVVKSVACTDDISLLRLNGPGVGLKPGILARVSSQLNKAGINIKSVITSQISINLIWKKNRKKSP
jgi:bifunctional aspartokinase / homoserine dehydrogenase 1